jgi:hypothetical protein
MPMRQFFEEDFLEAHHYGIYRDKEKKVKPLTTFPPSPITRNDAEQSTLPYIGELYFNETKCST